MAIVLTNLVDNQTSLSTARLQERNEKMKKSRTTGTTSACSVKSSKDTRQSRRPQVSSNAAVRSRLLGKLGIMTEEYQQQQIVERQRRRRQLSQRSDSFNEMLKGDCGARDEHVETGSLTSISSASTASTASSDSSLGGRSVSFATTVKVHPIAKRDAYSQRIRDSIWTSAEEMRIITARNCFEFAAESWDWRKVTNESEMILYNGELVHPVHFRPRFSLRHSFTPS